MRPQPVPPRGIVRVTSSSEQLAACRLSGMSTGVHVRGEEHHVRNSEVIRVGDRQERRAGADLREALLRTAMKLQLRRTGESDNLDAAPQDILGVACAERLHRRLLGCEPCRKMNGWHTAAVTVRDLALCEHALEKPVTVGRNGPGDPWDIGGVHPDADDVRHA